MLQIIIQVEMQIPILLYLEEVILETREVEYLENILQIPMKEKNVPALLKIWMLVSLLKIMIIIL